MATSFSSTFLSPLPKTRHYSNLAGVSPSRLIPTARNRSFKGGDFVGEDMIVLRERIQTIEITEKHENTTKDWMEWEKKYRKDYNSDVLEAVGLLQRWLLCTRPSLAIGMVGMVALSLPISGFVVSSQIIHVLKMIVLHVLK